MSNNPDKRILRAAPWFLAAVVCFYLIAINGQQHLMAKSIWPKATATVLGSQISYGAATTDDFQLTVNLLVELPGQKPYSSSLSQTAPKGALEKRIATNGTFTTGKKITVIVNPDNPQHVLQDFEPHYGPMILGLVLALLIASNGFSILYGNEKKVEDDQQHAD